MWLEKAPFHRHFTDRIAVAVTDAAPYSIEVVEPKAAVPQNGSINLKVVAKRAAGFTALALAPSAELVEGNKPEENYLMEPTVMPAPEITTLKDLETYRVVVLADVVRLPGSVAERMAAYVANGGGLLILAGPRADEGESFSARGEPALDSVETLAPCKYRGARCPASAGRAIT